MINYIISCSDTSLRLEAGSIRGRRLSQMFFAVSAEIGQGIEIHPVRYLRKRIARIVQVFLEDGYGMPVNIGHDRMSGQSFYRGGEIFLRNIQLIGIPAYRALRARISFGEKPHQFVYDEPGTFRRSISAIPLAVEGEDVVHHRQAETAHQLPVEAVPRI